MSDDDVRITLARMEERALAVQKAVERLSVDKANVADVTRLSEQVKGLLAKLWWLAGMVIAYVVSQVLGLLPGGGQ